MKRAMRTGLGLVLTTIALGVPPGLAQDEKQGKPPAGAGSSFDFGGVNVFEHAIPNAAGKSSGRNPRDLSSRRQIAASSPCPVSIHLWLCVVRRRPQPMIYGLVKVYQTGEGFYEMPGRVPQDQ